VEIGQKLIEVKERLGHGMFGAWISAEFEWGWTTASKLMQVANKFSHCENLDNFAPSALYILSVSSTPEVARTEALERATAGEQITYSTARDIVQEYKACDVCPQLSATA
jgi:hypothetical protein